MGVSCALQPLLTAVYSCIFALKKRHYFANKCPSSQGCGFSSSRVWTWELDHTESWVLKNWCFWTVVLEKTLESPLDCKEIKPVHPKGNQSWVFIGRTDVEAETPTLWLPHVKSWLTGKDPDAGRDWGREEKGTTEDEMAGWDHWLNEHEFEWTPGVGDRQGGLVCCSPWSLKELDTTEWLNWTEFVLKLCTRRGRKLYIWGSPSASSKAMGAEEEEGFQRRLWRAGGSWSGGSAVHLWRMSYWCWRRPSCKRKLGKKGSRHQQAVSLSSYWPRQRRVCYLRTEFVNWNWYLLCTVV